MSDILTEFVELRIGKVLEDAGKKDKGVKLDQAIDEKELPEEINDLINTQVVYFTEEAYKAGLKDGIKLVSG